MNAFTPVTKATNDYASDTLEIVAGQINVKLTKSADFRLSAAILLVQARERVASGEAGEGVTWWDWCRGNIQRSPGDINKLLKLAGSSEPAKALEEERVRNRVNKEASRSAAKSPGSVSADRNDYGTSFLIVDDEIIARMMADYALLTIVGRETLQVRIARFEGARP